MDSLNTPLFASTLAFLKPQILGVLKNEEARTMLIEAFAPHIEEALKESDILELHYLINMDNENLGLVLASREDAARAHAEVMVKAIIRMLEDTES